ncbi:MAG: hypothetical protein EP315_06405 [Gammaproteobacteria bacterium]|nr:MAG: hypothetical protein EP315_06405 [Gammaproteobacteria bacterium]
MSLTIKALLGVVIIYIGIRAEQKYNYKQRLIWDKENHWKIRTDSAESDARLSKGSYISPWLAILRFRTRHDETQSVVIFRDAIHPEQFRRLRVRLTIESGKLFDPSSN